MGNRAPASSEVWRLVSAVTSTPEIASRLRAEPDALFDEFGIETGLRARLLEATVESLGELGIHPMLRYRYLRALSGKRAGPSPLSHWLERL